MVWAARNANIRQCQCKILVGYSKIEHGQMDARGAGMRGSWRKRRPDLVPANGLNAETETACGRLHPIFRLVWALTS